MKISVKCKQCQKEFQKYLSEIKRMKKRGYQNHFCSNTCSREYNKNICQNILPERRKKEYLKNPKRCLNCKLVIPYEKKNENLKYCSSKCFAIHSQRNGGHCHWSEEDKKKLSNLAKLNPFWVKNYNKPKIRIKKICPICKMEFEKIPSQNKQIGCSRKCSNQWIRESGYYKNKGRGGFRPNSGTSKKGWYKGYFCGSSWELAWVIYQLEHNILIQRNKQGFNYTFNGKVKKYYPDFIVNGEYIEIKNYETEQVIEKVKQFPYKLTMLYKKDLEDVFQYVKQKYGKDYICLYEKKT